MVTLWNMNLLGTGISYPVPRIAYSSAYAKGLCNSYSLSAPVCPNKIADPYENSCRKLLRSFSEWITLDGRLDPAGLWSVLQLLFL